MSSQAASSQVRVLAVNAVPLLVWYVVVGGLVQLAARLGLDWLALGGAEVIGGVAALVVARRLHGGIAIYVILALLAYSTPLFIMHTFVGPQMAQGAPTHIAVLSAAIIGVCCGAVYRR